MTSRRFVGCVRWLQLFLSAPLTVTRLLTWTLIKNMSLPVAERAARRVIALSRKLEERR